MVTDNFSKEQTNSNEGIPMQLKFLLAIIVLAVTAILLKVVGVF